MFTFDGNKNDLEKYDSKASGNEIFKQMIKNLRADDKLEINVLNFSNVTGKKTDKYDYQRESLAVISSVNKGDKITKLVIGTKDFKENNRYVPFLEIKMQGLDKVTEQKVIDVLANETRDNWFQGRLAIISSDLAFVNDFKDKIEFGLEEKTIDDMKSIVSQINFIRNKFEYDKNFDFYKEMSHDNKKLSTKIMFVVDRKATIDGKVENNESSYTRRTNAVLDIMRQFSKDMEKYGKFLDAEEKTAIINAFTKSLQIRNLPKYEIKGNYIENGKKVPFDIKVEVRERGSLEIPKVKEMEHSDSNFPPPPPPGAGASAVTKEYPKKIKKIDFKKKKSLDLDRSF